MKFSKTNQKFTCKSCILGLSFFWQFLKKKILAKISKIFLDEVGIFSFLMSYELVSIIWEIISFFDAILSCIYVLCYFKFLEKWRNLICQLCEAPLRHLSVLHFGRAVSLVIRVSSDETMTDNSASPCRHFHRIILEGHCRWTHFASIKRKAFFSL